MTAQAVREALERLYSAAHGWAFDDDEGRSKATFDERYGELCELVLHSPENDGDPLTCDGQCVSPRLCSKLGHCADLQNDNDPAEAGPSRPRA